MSLVCFTDGSCKKNGSPDAISGLGVYFPTAPELSVSERCAKSKDPNVYESNIRAELLACIRCLEIIFSSPEKLNILPKTQVKIVTDSKFVISCITDWIPNNWLKNNWTKSDNSPVQNKDLLIRLYFYVKYLPNNVEFIFVRGHQPKPKNTESLEYFHWLGNNVADELAKDGSLISLPPE